MPSSALLLDERGLICLDLPEFRLCDLLWPIKLEYKKSGGHTQEEVLRTRVSFTLASMTVKIF